MTFDNYIDCNHYLECLRFENPKIKYSNYCYFDITLNKPIWKIIILH